MWWCLVVLAVVVWSWDASSVQCVKVVIWLQLNNNFQCVKVVIWLQSNNNFHTLHAACVPATHDHSQHNQASPHVLLNNLVLLTMGVMMPKTCWELINQENKHQIVVTSIWFYYLPTLMMHGHMNIKLLVSLLSYYFPHFTHILEKDLRRKHVPLLYLNLSWWPLRQANPNSILCPLFGLPSPLTLSSSSWWVGAHGQPINLARYDEVVERM